jgi:hypothetical protein
MRKVSYGRTLLKLSGDRIDTAECSPADLGKFLADETEKSGG